MKPTSSQKYLKRVLVFDRSDPETPQSLLISLSSPRLPVWSTRTAWLSYPASLLSSRDSCGVTLPFSSSQSGTFHLHTCEPSTPAITTATNGPSRLQLPITAVQQINCRRGHSWPFPQRWGWGGQGWRCLLGWPKYTYWYKRQLDHHNIMIKLSLFDHPIPTRRGWRTKEHKGETFKFSL